MLFLKFILITLFVVWCNSSFAGPPSCDTRMPIFENQSIYNERLEKYNVEHIDMRSMKFAKSVDFCTKKVTMLVYQIFLQRQLKKDIRWHSPVIYDDEKNEIIKLLNLITDNPKKSQQIFDIFYDDYLNRHYQEKQNCSNKCRFSSETLVDGLKITVVGEVYDIENIALRKKSHIIRLFIERVG